MRNSHSPLPSSYLERPQPLSYVAWLQKELKVARKRVLELELQPASSLDGGESLWNRRARAIRAALQYAEVADDRL